MHRIRPTRTRVCQQGFSLIEMLIVVAVLTTVLAVVFSGISAGVQKYRVEESRLDITQESRDFLDQVIRDLHTIGYPSLHMYNNNPNALGATPASSPLLAVGLVAVSSTDIWFEGDVDGSGIVRSVRYTLQADNTGSCPCRLMRSYVPKVAAAPDAQAVQYETEVQNVTNSVGGAAAYPIAGSTRFPNGTVANDVLYAGYKTAPVFTYYDQNNAVLIVPPTLTGGNLAAGEAAVANVRSIGVVVNLLSQYPDPTTHLLQAVSTQGSVKLNNL
jgi:prepilin-type N-terminal cleavage/methylation domain-containing protein